MDMGINNISRTIGRTDPELEIKKPQAVEKQAEVNSVSENQSQDAADASQGKVGLNQQTEDGTDASKLTEMTSKINELFQAESRSLQFSVDEESGRSVVRVVDTKTGEQIKQIPAEELLEISRRLAAQLDGEEAIKSGVLVKSKA